MLRDGNIFIKECACVACVYSNTRQSCTEINDVNRGMSVSLMLSVFLWRVFTHQTSFRAKLMLV